MQHLYSGQGYLMLLCCEEVLSEVMETLWTRGRRFGPALSLEHRAEPHLLQLRLTVKPQNKVRIRPAPTIRVKFPKVDFWLAARAFFIDFLSRTEPLPNRSDPAEPQRCSRVCPEKDCWLTGSSVSETQSQLLLTLRKSVNMEHKLLLLSVQGEPREDIRESERR